MKKIITMALAVIMAANMTFAQEDVLIVKPGGIFANKADGTDGKDYPWSSVSAKTDPKYRMQKVEGSDDLYRLTMTLDRCYRSAKWAAKWGDTAPTEGHNEGWAILYAYRVVLEEGYDNVKSGFRMFEVPADGTEVTFYAKVLTKGDGTKEVRAICDAQELVITDGAGVGQGNIPPAIGKKVSSNAYYLDGKEANVQARLGNSDRCDAYVGNANSDFGGKLNVRDGEPGRKAQKGRGIITVHYETVSLSVEKSIDEFQALEATINDIDLTTIAGDDLGVFNAENRNMPVTASLNTVLTNSNYPLLTAISEENTNLNLCYTIVKEDDEAEPIVLKRPFALGEGATNMTAAWTLGETNLLEGLELEAGSYTLSFWFESEYTAEFGKDVIKTDNEGVPFSATFTVEDGDGPATGFDAPTLQANISTVDQTIRVTFEGTADVKLYSVSGLLVDEQQVTGVYAKAVHPGIYVLSVDKKAYKVVVR